MRGNILGWSVGLCLLLSFDASAAPQRRRPLHDTLGDIQHDMNNHETEIRVLEEKLRNQEVIVESLEKRIRETKRVTKGSASGQNERIAQVEKGLKGLTTNVRELQKHANQSAEALATYKEHIDKLDKHLEMQNKNIELLQVAMRSLVEALELDTDPGQRIHMVKTGDSLGQIALDYKVSTKRLKELNGLKRDVIIVGQKLKIPES